MPDTTPLHGAQGGTVGDHRGMAFSCMPKGRLESERSNCQVSFGGHPTEVEQRLNAPEKLENPRRKSSIPIHFSGVMSMLNFGRCNISRLKTSIFHNTLAKNQPSDKNCWNPACAACHVASPCALTSKPHVTWQMLTNVNTWVRGTFLLTFALDDCYEIVTRVPSDDINQRSTT